MPLYPQSILKKPTEFPPVPFNLDEDDRASGDLDNDNDSLDIILPKQSLLRDDFADFDRPRAKPGKHFLD